MTTREQLNAYLAQLERRLRLGALLNGTAVLVGAALAATVLLVMVTNALAFSPGSLTGARIALFLILAFALCFAIVFPLMKLNRRWAAQRAEGAFPEFEERLLTFADQATRREGDPFVDLLAADALEVARRSEPGVVVPAAKLAGASAAGMGALAILLWLILAGPGYFGHGASLLWAGTPKGGGGMQSFYDIRVAPGDATVRRKADQLITAQLKGMTGAKVQLLARFQSSSKWEPVAMQPQAGTGYEFLFAGLPESVDYYVQAGALKSPQYTLRVVDLPTVRNIRITYKYPAWSGLAQEVVDHGGDLRAVEGTEALLEIETDKPLKEGRLVIDGNREILVGTEVGKNLYRATVRVEKDGVYHVAATDQNQRVRISDDFFIEARKETPPTIKISRPGKDYRASPIEEVSISVQADDDYGLQEVALHYSVNGGPEQTVPLTRQNGSREAQGTALIALEDHKLVPGDVVAFYATARDARTTSRTDMAFIEAQPFEKEFQQMQQAGGGGGGGEDDPNKISERQKEIIAATFNQLRDKKASREETTEAGKFLSDVQAKLKDQATSLSKRMQSRELSAQNQEFQSFAKEMTAAADEMGRAAAELKGLKWQDSLPFEQKALQHLLRAEATFRQIQVAFGRQGGGGGGGGAARDLENLFDLELDTEKNQYETGQQQSAGGGQDREKQVDEALQKLEQLARRQQELAQQQQQNKQSVEQRWQQEMLRRRAEELKREMEQLSRNGQQQQQGNSQSQSSSSSSSSSSASSSQQQQQSGQQRQRQQQGQMDPRVQQALDRLKQATEDMRQAASSSAGQQNNPQQSQADARRAAERLSEARDMLSGMRRQQAGGQMDDVARRTEELADKQQEFSRKLMKSFGDKRQQANGLPSGNKEENERMAAERQKMSEEMSRLEKDMQGLARDLQSSQRGASGKLREALGEMQQKELGLRMKYSADMIRRGYGQYAYMRDSPINEILESMREKVRQAKQMMEGNKGGDAGGDKGQQLESAVNRVERMRRQMEMLGRDPKGGEQQQGSGDQQGQGREGERNQKGQSQGKGGAKGQQGQQGEGGGERAGDSGQGQGGQQGQSKSNQQGGQQSQGDAQGGGGGQFGGPREARQGGSRGDADFSAMNRGGYLPELGAGRPGQPGAAPSGLAGLEGAYREGMRDLNRMRQELGTENPDAARDVQDMLRELQRLDPSRFQGNPQLVEQLRTQLLANLEQMELQLRRKLDDKNTGQVRSTPARQVPQGYQESVADYFRRLSRGK